MAILNSEWVWWIAQIVINIILLVAVIILAGRLRSQPRGSLAAQEQTAFAASDFMEQAGLLVSEFDRLLGEKRELVGTTLATLDARIEELRAMLDQAESRHASLSSQLKSAPPWQSPATTRNSAPKLGNSEPEPAPSTPADPFNLPPGHPLHAMTNDESVVLSEQEFRDKVIKMAASGQSVQAIALATRRPRAEVELVMALLK